MKPNIGQGDTGRTALFGGGPKVSKDSPQVEAYGSLDELNAWVGYLCSTSTFPELAPLLRQIQEDLFVGGAVVAAARDVPGYPSLGQEAIAFLEGAIQQYEEGVPELRTFILPGGVPEAALFDLARTACRRAERRVAAFLRRRERARPRVATPESRAGDPLRIKHRAVLAYVNRLSDLLFALERWVNHRRGAREHEWIGMRGEERGSEPRP